MALFASIAAAVARRFGRPGAASEGRDDERRAARRRRQEQLRRRERLGEERADDATWIGSDEDGD